MIFTDPPYGMDLDTDFRDMVGIGVGKKYEKIIGDEKEFNPQFILKRFKSCKEIFLWGADYYSEKIKDRNNGSWFVWDKTFNGPNDDYDKMFGNNFELCWSKNKHKRALVRILWKGIFGLSKEDTKKRIHPAQKPTSLMIWFIEKFSSENGIILDLYIGSGSSLIACEKTNRVCYGMEIDPHYCDVTINRYREWCKKNKRKAIIKRNEETWQQKEESLSLQS